MKKLKFGARATWTEGGRVRIANVVQVVEPGELPSKVEFPELHLNRTLKARDAVSYVLHIPDPNRRARGTFFWPPAALLKTPKI